jgi:hypothetical protein
MDVGNADLVWNTDRPNFARDFLYSPRLVHACKWLGCRSRLAGANGTNALRATLIYRLEIAQCGDTPMMRRSVSSILLLLLSLAAGLVSAAEQPAQKVESAPTAERSVKNLDLRVPNITTLYTSEQIASFLARTRRDDLDEVEVRGTRDRVPTVTPEVWPGIAAPFWALMNPTQAWRIFAPLPPDQTRALASIKPDATNTFREPAAKTAAGL